MATPNKDPQTLHTVPMDDQYFPAKVEAGWDQFWENNELYKPTDNKDEKNFVIVLPPPNVTGSLHLGHALTVAIQDSVVRWHRMQGHNTLWVPGLDHAGIATQVVVEKQLKKTQGLSRHDLGREKFVEKVWEWKEQYGGKILEQLRALGTSLDWSRLRFTLDEMCQKAVLEAFVRMHQKKIIYRDNRLVSWSCALKSAISSIEVDHTEVTGSTLVNVPGYDGKVEIGVIHSFSYQVKDSDEKLTVATTRIETMLGDVAVAVNSKDPRYTHLHGKELIHPFIPDRKIVVITDDTLVDMAFGTGAVKITPAHDPNDNACGMRHNLPCINILDDEGKMNANAGDKYFGMHRFAVRERIVADLEALGLYVGKADNAMSIGFCSRSQDIVEPLVKPQWWVASKNMADRALKSAQDGELNIMPAQHQGHWAHWLNNIQDWCISRQLWWGHRIPAYYALPAGQTWPVEVEDASRWIIAKTAEEAAILAKEKFSDEYTLHQDEDVLDTWFSSGLFPFSVMGWPNVDESNTDFQRFFPGDLLETGSDILFFWVARMVFMSQELTDKLPFHTVYLHSLVRDRLGRKMSKSTGNVIDPVDVIQGVTLDELLAKLMAGNLSAAEVEKASANQKSEFPEGIQQCGADALRFGLLSYTKQGGDINLDINVITSSRHFCNKLWQATRFALMNFGEDFDVPNGYADVLKHINAVEGGMMFEQEWLLTKLTKLVKNINENYQSYEFGAACGALQSFFTDDLCSRYLECIKTTVKKSGANYEPKRAQSLLSVLYHALDVFLRLLHPMMPFVTEELYHRLPGHAERTAKAETERLRTGSIMVQTFPTVTAEMEQFLTSDIETKMTLAISVIEAIRGVKARLLIPNHTKPTAHLHCLNQQEMDLFNTIPHLISTLAFVSTPTASLEAPQQADSIRALISASVTLYLQVDGTTLDFSNELVKNQRRLVEIQQEYEVLKVTVEKTKDNPKVKQEVKDKNNNALAEMEAEIPLLKHNIGVYDKIVTPEKYKVAKVKDLQQQIEVTKRALDKLNGLIAKAKKPSDKQLNEQKSLQDAIVAFEAEIVTLQ